MIKKIKGTACGPKEYDTISSKKEKEYEYYLPSFELNDNDVPEIRDFKIGEKIIITVEVTPKRISKREEKEEEDKSTTICELEIQGVEVKRNETLNEKVGSKEARDPNRM